MSMSYSDDSINAQLDVNSLISKVYRLLGHDCELTATCHASAVRKLSRLRDLIGSQIPSENSQLLLTCTGIHMWRKSIFASTQEENDEMLITSALLFILICLSNSARSGWPSQDHETTEFTVLNQSWYDASQSGFLPSSVVEYALTTGAHLLNGGSLAQVTVCASIFFKHSNDHLRSMKLLKDDDDCDFLSLSVSAFTSATNDDDDERVKAIIHGGESEAGQMVLRDIMLSFMLPISLVGVRRTLLLTRESSHRATVDFAEIVQDAHETAMAGVEWTYFNASDDFHRSCAILAGLACLTTRDGPDPIRKGIAFGGRVSLPFIEARVLKNDVLRIAYITTTDTWVLHKISASGQPVIVSSYKGYTGLKLSSVALVASL